MNPARRSAPICLAMMCASMLIPAHANTVHSEVGGNTADAAQTGSGNSANITQSGTGNRATVVQSGNGNRSLVRQSGNNGSVTHEQRGNGRDARTVQSGSPAGQIIIRQTQGD